MSASPGVSRPAGEALSVCDPVWTRLRGEADAVLREEPQLASFIVATILNHASLEGAVAHRVAARLGHASLPSELIAHGFHEAIQADPGIGASFRADIVAVMDRDPATFRALEPVLYFKGFHALQAHRLAHHFWNRGRRDLALYLQSRSSEVFQCDIHPAARIGRGVFLDHATGLVVGSTAVIEDDVSILHAVTLGGTGKQGADRHPKIRRGVMIGAGAKILGNIEVGECARVAAGSVVLRPVPAHTTVVGVPAR
ncbi:serine O-acetyltransferase, partial [Methylobacterium trifolii]